MSELTNTLFCDKFLLMAYVLSAETLSLTLIFILGFFLMILVKFSKTVSGYVAPLLTK